MSDSDPDKFLAPRVWVMQVIVLALVIGVVVFFGIVIFLRNGPNPPRNVNLAPPTITYTILGCAALMVVLYLFLPRLVAANGRKQIARGTWNPSTPQNPIPADQLSRMSDAEKLCLVYQSQFVVGVALLEAANFSNLIAYLLEGEVVSLIVVGLLVLVQLARFPTRDRVERLLSEQGELLRRDRQAV